MSHSTKRSANNLNDQDLRPSGGAEQAVATRNASPSPSNSDLQRPDDGLVRLPPRLRMLVRQQQYPGVCDFAGRGFAYRYQVP